MRLGALAGLIVVAALAGCTPQGPAASARVRAGDYDQFFLWAGVPASNRLDKARTVYVLAGEIRSEDPLRLVSLRGGIPRTRNVVLWLTVRAERLDWNEGIYQSMLDQLAAWRAAGNRVVGVQVDFDAATRGLADYEGFLRGLRARLPDDCRLSITGLMDWSANGEPGDLASLSGVVDEVVVQTYQGRRTIPEYARYFRGITRLPVPHKVALVEGGEWTPPPELARDPMFRGYVVFLLRP